MQEELGYPRAGSGGWNTCSSRGPGPSPRGSRDHLADLAAVVGRRHSSEMDESRYYTDRDGRERIRLIRSGTVAPAPGQGQWEAG